MRFPADQGIICTRDCQNLTISYDPHAAMGDSYGILSRNISATPEKFPGASNLWKAEVLLETKVS